MENRAQLKSAVLNYVTDSLDKLFLSRVACVALAVVPESFPLVQSRVKHSEADVHASSTALCGCLIRKLPPPYLMHYHS